MVTKLSFHSRKKCVFSHVEVEEKRRKGESPFHMVSELWVHQLSGRRRKGLQRRCPFSEASWDQLATGMVESWSSRLTSSICLRCSLWIHSAREHDGVRKEQSYYLDLQWVPSLDVNYHLVELLYFRNESIHTFLRRPVDRWHQIVYTCPLYMIDTNKHHFPSMASELTYISPFPKNTLRVFILKNY